MPVPHWNRELRYWLFQLSRLNFVQNLNKSSWYLEKFLSVLHFSFCFVSFHLGPKSFGSREFRSCLHWIDFCGLGKKDTLMKCPNAKNYIKRWNSASWHFKLLVFNCHSHKRVLTKLGKMSGKYWTTYSSFFSLTLKSIPQRILETFLVTNSNCNFWQLRYNFVLRMPL